MQQDWWDTYVRTNRDIRISVRVYNLNDRYSAVWLLYGTPSRNTAKAREGFFRFFSGRGGRGEFYTDFQTREISGMRIGYDQGNRFVRDIIIPVDKLVGDTSIDVLRSGGYNLDIEADFDAFSNGDDRAVKTSLKKRP